MVKRKRSDKVKHKFCPGCGSKGLKKFEAVLVCPVCTRAWFILQTSGAPDESV